MRFGFRPEAHRPASSVAYVPGGRVELQGTSDVDAVGQPGGDAGGGQLRETAAAATSQQGRWPGRHNPLLTATCAILVPALYLLFVYRYAVDSLFGDDWNTLPVIHRALHGHLTFGALWSQYNETRIPVIRVVMIGFAVADHLDIRAVILLNALVFVASYGVVLALYWRYIDRPLTPIPVLL